MKKKPIVIASIVIFSFVLLLIVVSNFQTKTSFKYDNMSAKELEPQKNEQDLIQKEVINSAKAQEDSKSSIDINKIESKILEIMPNDMILGNQNAPITIIEYASLSCPHCAYFVRDAFPKLKNEYIDQGLVKFIFRDFPLNQPALSAGVVARCYSDNKTVESTNKYYEFLKLLFKSQDSWAFDQDFIKKIEIVAKIQGIDEEQFKSCLERKDIAETILKGRMEASKELQINSTPTFFINGQSSAGYTDYLKIKNIIEAELSKIK